MTQEIENYLQTNRFLSTESRGNGIDSNSIEIHLIIILLCFSCLGISTSLSFEAMAVAVAMGKAIDEMSPIQATTNAHKSARHDHLFESVTLSLTIESAWISRREAIDNRLNNFHLVIIT